MLEVGSYVALQGSLKVEWINGVCCAITTDIYQVLSLEEDAGGYIEVRDVNIGWTKYAKKDKLIRIYGG